MTMAFGTLRIGTISGGIDEEKLHPESLTPINEFWEILQAGFVPVGKDGEGRWIVAGIYP